MRDTAETTILVTGATDGLGKRVAQELAAKGATVLLHGRSSSRPQATPEALRRAESAVRVTGATDALGKRVAQELAAKGATVLLHGRSSSRLEATLEELRKETGSEKLGSYLADLSSLGEVRGLAEQVLSEQDRLDVLINNAGIIAQEREETADGADGER